ncbi:hypothetical protein BH09PAT1_BH09PAT1_7590 [soil metagenome]
MPSLYQTTSLVKTISKWVGIILGGILLIVLLYRGGKLLAAALFPKQPDPPKVAYGKLPAIIFPDNANTTPYTFTLDTITGTLGTFPDRANVYKTTSPVQNLLNLQNARDNLSQTTFNTGETYINDTQYSWRDITRADKVLNMNIVSNDFTITSNYITYPDLTPEKLIDPSIAATVVTGFLTNLNNYPLDFDPTKTATQLLTMQGTSLFAAASVSEADVVRVDLFQKDLNKLPIMYAHPPYSSAHFLVGGINTNEILEGTFAHQIVTNDSSTYPLITITEAYNILKQNKAYIASNYGTSNDVSIKNVYLGYYMSDQKQSFVLPIYVFEGKNGFFAYVSAVSNTWIH